MADWTLLTDELDRWADSGRPATLWWRDDDAARAVPALDRLLATRAETGVPLALAVIPATLEDAAAGRIDDDADTAVLQHGYAHRNHAAPDARKAELGPGRRAADVLDELATGRRRLAAAFRKRVMPVLVPPWNRVAGAVVGRLAGAGFTGLSAYGRRESARPAPGLDQVNTHVDIIDWRGSRGFVGDDAALALAIAHLRARRAGEADGDEPTGLLTHHLAHDAAAWTFLARLLPFLTGHPATSLIPAAEAFAISPGKTSGKAP